MLSCDHSNIQQKYHLDSISRAAARTSDMKRHFLSFCRFCRCLVIREVYTYAQRKRLERRTNGLIWWNLRVQQVAQQFLESLMSDLRARWFCGRDRVQPASFENTLYFGIKIDPIVNFKIQKYLTHGGLLFRVFYVTNPIDQTRSYTKYIWLTEVCCCEYFM